MGNWKELAFAVNSTIPTKTKEPLDKIIKPYDVMFVESDDIYYNIPIKDNPTQYIQRFKSYGEGNLRLYPSGISAGGYSVVVDGLTIASGNLSVIGKTTIPVKKGMIEIHVTVKRGYLTNFILRGKENYDQGAIRDEN